MLHVSRCRKIVCLLGQTDVNYAKVRSRRRAHFREGGCQEATSHCPRDTMPSLPENDYTRPLLSYVATLFFLDHVLTFTSQIALSATNKANRVVSICVKTATVRGKLVARLIRTGSTYTSGPTFIGRTRTSLPTKSVVSLAGRR